MSEDSQLQQAVIGELDWEPSVDAAHVSVTAHAGVVTLTGHVHSFAQRYSAEAAAWRVKSVKAVVEALEVDLPFDARRDDGDIAAAAINRLDWDTSLPADSVHVTVEKGWVTLTGQVGWQFQRDAAMHDVSHLLGVVGVANEITIKPAQAATNISDNIMHALHRSWFFDPKTVSVSVNQGVVHLTGKVRSRHDREVAAHTAWAAPGTVAVENHITVG